jgi:isochorismate synthase
MTASTTQPISAFDGLQRLIGRARQEATRLGRPVLARLCVDLGPAGEPSLDHLVSRPDAFIWQQANRGFAFAAIGQAARIAANGRQRFAELRSQLQRLVQDGIIENDAAPTLPLAYAGFAFDPEHPDNVAWFGFPDAVAVVPRTLLVINGGRLRLAANALVAAETETTETAADLAADAARLLPAASKPEADVAHARLLDPGTEARLYWQESVRGLTDRIAAGDAEKVVLARRVIVESKGGFDARAALQRLRSRYRDCTLFALRAGDACFLGATPETLVRLHGRSVRADCLAGSYPRGARDAEDRRLGEALLADEKELREHAFVTRSLREALADVCSEIDHPDRPSLRRMANLQHLATPVEATTDGPRHVLELVERLHPTAATAGLPRGRSLELIREHEPFSRGWYAGPIGWIDAAGGGDFAVALRSALLRDDVASLYAGCGIVAGSDSDREYEESGLKLQAMLYALNATAPETQSPSPSGEGQG